MEMDETNGKLNIKDGVLLNEKKKREKEKILTKEIIIHLLV
mgnify:CR=1 FL=1